MDTSTLTRSTILDAPADTVWQAVLTPQSFVTVTRGMLRMPALTGRTRPWQQGEKIVDWVWLFGVVPCHRHDLTVELVDPTARLLRSNERGGLIRSWRHDISLEPIDERRCRYTDRLDIDAGWATLPVTGFAWVFYRYRQRRWRQLARRLAAAEPARDGGFGPGSAGISVDDAQETGGR
jgi:ligand-binding SRPBCC domain-containing protein